MSFADSYGRIERLVHYVAFGLPFVQRSLTAIENDSYAEELSTVEVSEPVFISGLPRAGTTLTLELLYATGEFASFTYRQMPFVLSPLLWHRLSANFQRDAVTRERSHGDGMGVSFDSPEAFEEVFWIAHLGERLLRSDSICPLSADDITLEVRSAFHDMVKKLILLERRRGSTGRRRYISKNNANISRLGALVEVFPDAIVLVPFRDPASQARSLHRQHLRFSEEHARTRFSKQYMRWIGHFEFGENFKPIAFDGSCKRARPSAPESQEFWLEYWCQAYEHVLKCRRGNIFLLNFDELVRNSVEVGSRLAPIVKVREEASLLSATSKVEYREPSSRETDPGRGSLPSRAREIHEQLVERAL